MVTRDELNSLSVAAHTAVSADCIADISNISIDPQQPPHTRIDHFIFEVENPYLFRVRNTVVHLSFTDNGPPLTQLLEEVARITNC